MFQICPPQPLTIAVTSAMSCLALTLTCKSRPLWMQTLLVNDAKPAQYEAEIARLNALLARSEERRKADWEHCQRMQQSDWPNYTWQDQKNYFMNKYDQMQRHWRTTVSQAFNVLASTQMTNWSLENIHERCHPSQNAICEAMRILRTRPPGVCMTDDFTQGAVHGMMMTFVPTLAPSEEENTNSRSSSEEEE